VSGAVGIKPALRSDDFGLIGFLAIDCECKAKCRLPRWAFPITVSLFRYNFLWVFYTGWKRLASIFHAEAFNVAYVVGQPSYRGVGSMFDAIWLALILGLFGVGLAYLVACDRV
jgi:hypothetical protein